MHFAHRVPVTVVWGVALIGAVLLGSASPLPADAAAGRDRPADAAVLDAYLEHEVAASPVPGLAVAVTRGDEIVHLGGYGDAGDGQSMTPDTPVRVASLSKSITAAAVLQLVERGELDLDDPVQRHLPDFTLLDEAAASRITVRHLLNQTSGLADPGFPDLWEVNQDSLAERTALLSSARPVDEPGTTHHYFNPNYEVLARLVEVASGEDFDDYLRRHVFEPLGMTATVSVTRAADAESAVPGLARGHVVAFGVPLPRDEPDGFLAGSGGVVTTARDHARWLAAQHPRGDGPRILDADSLTLAHGPPDGVDSTYGMGWWTASSGEQAVVEHNGVLTTFYAEQVLVPETGHGIALLANANHAFTDVPRMKHDLVALLAGGEPQAPPTTHRRLVLLLAALLLTGVAVRLRGIRRRHEWARRATAHGWRAPLGVGRLLLPAVVLLGLPVLVALVAGRTFPHRLLLLSAPELVVWLAVASATGILLAATRMLALRRSRNDRDTASGQRQRLGAAVPTNFDSKARTWDEDPDKVERARTAADAIRRTVPLAPSTRLLEYGAGTGLVSQFLAGEVGSVTLAEPSAGMRDVMADKVAAGTLPADARIWDLDLATGAVPEERFDLIATVMTLHHVHDVERVLRAFAALLDGRGHLCIVDLEKEDGSFHRSDLDFDGHHGFERGDLAAVLRAAGFPDVRFERCHAIEREGRRYPLFLAAAEVGGP